MVKSVASITVFILAVFRRTIIFYLVKSPLFKFETVVELSLITEHQNFCHCLLCLFMWHWSEQK